MSVAAPSPSVARAPTPFRLDADVLAAAKEQGKLEKRSLSSVVESGLTAYLNGTLPNLPHVPDRLPDEFVATLAKLDEEYGSPVASRVHPNPLNAYLALLANNGWPLPWIADAMPARSVSSGIRQRISSVRNDDGAAWPDVPVYVGKKLAAATRRRLQTLLETDRKAGTTYAAALVRAGWPLDEVAAAAGETLTKPTKTRVHQRVIAGSPADPERNRTLGADYMPPEQLPPVYPAPIEVTSRITRRGPKNATTSFNLSRAVYADASAKASEQGLRLPLLVEAILRDYATAGA